MYQKRFCFSQIEAGEALAITYLVAALFSAPLGLLIDRVGYKRYFIMAGMAVFTTAQLIILLYPQCSDNNKLNGSIIGLAFIGLGYCFYGNCILPSVPLIVKKKVTGTAFGIMQMIESIALAFIPLINGRIIDKTNGSTSSPIGYKNSSIFFVTIGFAGLITSFGLFCISDKVKKIFDHGSLYLIKVWWNRYRTDMTLSVDNCTD